MSSASVRLQCLVAAESYRWVANTCGKAFRAPLVPLAIHLARPAPRSNAWWQMQRLRFAGSNQSQSVTSPDRRQTRHDPSKKSRGNQACSTESTFNEVHATMGRLFFVPSGLIDLCSGRMLRSIAPAHNEPELQRHSQSAAHGFSDEGEPCRARAGDAQDVGGDAPLPANSEIARGSRTLCSARRAALRQWRCPHGHCAQQDSKGLRGEIADDARQTRAVRPGLGLSRASDRIQSGQGIARAIAA